MTYSISKLSQLSLHLPDAIRHCLLSQKHIAIVLDVYIGHS